MLFPCTVIHHIYVQGLFLFNKPAESLSDEKVCPLFLDTNKMGKKFLALESKSGRRKAIVGRESASHSTN